MALTACRECTQEISSDAKTCPKCGIADPAGKIKQQQAAGMMGCLASSIILLGLVAFCSLAPDSRSTSTANDLNVKLNQEKRPEFNAFVVTSAREAVKNLLRSPNQADFSWVPAQMLSLNPIGTRWYLAEKFDAQNGFGAMIQTQYRAWVRRVCDDEAKVQCWSVSRLVVDGQEILSTIEQEEWPVPHKPMNMEDRSRGETELMYAAQFGDVDTVKELLRTGASVSAADKDGWTALHYASAGGEHHESMAALIGAGADPNAAVPNDDTPLCMSAAKGKEREVDVLLKGKADPNVRCSLGRTALVNAAYAGHTDDEAERIVKLLLAAGADPSIRDDDKRTALSYAKENRRSRIVKLLTASLIKP